MANSTCKEIVLTLNPINCRDTVGKRRILLNKSNPAIIVGRGSSNKAKNLVPAEDNAYFDSPVMSRNHALVELDDNEFVTLTDTDSMHGTYVDGGQRLQQNSPLALVHGMMVKFGSEVIRGEERFPPKTFSIGIDRRVVSPPRESSVRTGYGVTTEDLILDDVSDAGDDDMYDSPDEPEWGYSPSLRATSHSSPPAEEPISSVREVLEDDPIAPVTAPAAPIESSRVIECNVEEVDVSFAESSKPQEINRKTSRVAIQDLMNGDSDMDDVLGSTSSKPLVIEESEGEGETSKTSTSLGKRRIEVVDITSDGEDEQENKNEGFGLPSKKAMGFPGVGLNTPHPEKEESANGDEAEVPAVKETAVDTDSEQVGWHTPKNSSPIRDTSDEEKPNEASASKADSTIAGVVIADLAASSKPGTDLSKKAASLRERAQEFFKSRDDVEKPNPWAPNDNKKEEEETAEEPLIKMPSWLQNYYRAKNMVKQAEKASKSEEDGETSEEDDENMNGEFDNDPISNSSEDEDEDMSDNNKENDQVSQWSGKRQPSMVNSASVEESDEDADHIIDSEVEEGEISEVQDDDSEMESNHSSEEEEEDDQSNSEEDEEDEGDEEAVYDDDEEEEDSMEEDEEQASMAEASKGNYIASAQPLMANVPAESKYQYPATVPAAMPYGILPYPQGVPAFHHTPSVWEPPVNNSIQPPPIEPQWTAHSGRMEPVMESHPFDYALPYNRSQEQNSLPYNIGLVPTLTSSVQPPPPQPQPQPQLSSTVQPVIQEPVELAAAATTTAAPAPAPAPTAPAPVEEPKQTPKKRNFEAAFAEESTPTRSPAANAGPKETLHDELGAMEISDPIGDALKDAPAEAEAEGGDESTPKKAKGNHGKAIARYAGTALAGAVVGGMAMFAALVATATEY